MGVSDLADGEVQLSLLAVTGHAGLAAEVLVSRFGLEDDHARAVLEQGYGLLVSRIPRSRARAALPLLAALGLRVAIQPCEALPPDEYCDVSVRLADVRAARKAIATVERFTGLAELTPASFGGVAGLVLRNLPTSRADALCHALKRLTGVLATSSEIESARFDLFAEAELTETETLALRGQLRLVGCTLGGFGDALGCGLERRVLDRILARFPGMGLFGVNQAFQRHDLLIIGRGSLSQTDLADFLVTRPVGHRLSARELMRALPLRVETNLTRTAAAQFLSDYTSIGMQAITRLVRRADAGWKNA